MAGIADDAAGPIEHAFAFRGKALETGAAIDQQNAERFLELLQPRRQGGLSDTTTVGRAAKMLLARQSEQKFKLVEQSLSPLRVKCAIQRRE